MARLYIQETSLATLEFFDSELNNKNASPHRQGLGGMLLSPALSSSATSHPAGHRDEKTCDGSYSSPPRLLQHDTCRPTRHHVSPYHEDATCCGQARDQSSNWRFGDGGTWLITLTPHSSPNTSQNFHYNVLGITRNGTRIHCQCANFDIVAFLSTPSSFLYFGWLLHPAHPDRVGIRAFSVAGPTEWNCLPAGSVRLRPLPSLRRNLRLICSFLPMASQLARYTALLSVSGYVFFCRRHFKYILDNNNN